MKSQTLLSGTNTKKIPSISLLNLPRECQRLKYANPAYINYTCIHLQIDLGLVYNICEGTFFLPDQPLSFFHIHGI